MKIKESHVKKAETSSWIKKEVLNPIRCRLFEILSPGISALGP